MKKKEVFRSKQDALSVWLQDQWSLISHLGKIAADPVVLEQQILQVQSLQSESRSRKIKIGELMDLSQDASDFERKEVQQLKSRWNELETKLEERLISINEALKCRKEIETETSTVQDFLAILTQDLAISGRIPPSVQSINDMLQKLKFYNSEIDKMKRANQRAQEAAEFLSQVAAGAENFGSKPQSASQALNISYKKLTERIKVLEQLLLNLNQAHDLRDNLIGWLKAAEDDENLTKEDIEKTKKEVDRLASLGWFSS